MYKKYKINPSGDETGLFCKNKADIIADALKTWITTHQGAVSI